MVTGFDGLIVITSFIELRLDGSGAITAFRGFRLLRIFKLAKKWTSFRVLVSGTWPRDGDQQIDSHLSQDGRLLLK